MRRFGRTLRMAPLMLAWASAFAAVDYIHVDGFEALDCSAPLACPTPAPGKACISGRVRSAANGKVLRAAFGAELTCGAGAVGGPCDLSLTAVDALDFANNPVGATPLPSTSKVVDGCGRFRIDGLTPPPLGFVALVTEDADSAPESDLHVAGAAPYPLGANQAVNDATAIEARRDTVARWTQSAGTPFGASTFSDVGVLLLQFRAGGVPRAGVTATANGSAVVGKDYYFADTITTDRLFIDSLLASTGANGAALFAEGQSVQYSGTGAEPMGCTWPAQLGFSIPGVVLYLQFEC